MKRREFIALLGGAATWSFAARAQQPERMRRIGVLMGYADTPITQARLTQFRQALEELGWTEGGNVRIDYRFAASDPARMRAYASELLRLAPDAIFASTPPVLAALNQQTRSVPIVFVNVADPIGAGLAQSLGRPGGNMTGFTNFEFSIAGKWLELLKEIAPSLVRVGVVMMPEHVTNAALFRAAAPAAEWLKLQLIESSVRSASEIERAIEAVARQVNSSLLVLPSALATDNQQLIVSLALRHHLPAVYPYRELADGGGLIYYGPETLDDYRRAASYVDRILRGEKPAGIPIQAPTKFELGINLRTAKALGLSVPPTLLARADKVIE